MAARTRRHLLYALLAAAALASAGCGTQEIELAQDDPNYARRGALRPALLGLPHARRRPAPQGSASSIDTREYKDGPSFNERVESADDVLYAIRNGGFSSGPMPQNIITGEEAEAVAEFVAKYSGKEAERPPIPTGGNPPAPPGAEPPEARSSPASAAGDARSQGDPPRPRAGARRPGAPARRVRRAARRGARARRTSGAR